MRARNLQLERAAEDIAYSIFEGAWRPGFLDKTLPPTQEDDFELFVSEEVGKALFGNTNSNAFCDQIILDCARIGRPLPDSLRRLLEKRIGQANRQRGRPSMKARDEVIVFAIETILEELPGLTPMRSETSKRCLAAPRSACAIVKQILSHFGWSPSEQQIETIWKARTGREK